VNAAASASPREEQPRYAKGERVRVLNVHPPGHVRTPHYARGRTGVVERYAGRFENPEERAYGRRGGTLKALYRVRFLQSDLWPGYAGAPTDTVDIDLYEHWLEPVETL
jgi:nitrile hydratase subunit beta